MAQKFFDPTDPGVLDGITKIIGDSGRNLLIENDDNGVPSIAYNRDVGGSDTTVFELGVGPTTGRFEVLYKARIAETPSGDGGFMFLVGATESNDYNNVTGYTAHPYANRGYFGCRRWNGGTDRSSLAAGFYSAPRNWDLEAAVWFRLQFDPSTGVFRSKHWVDGNAEPSGWDFEYTDSPPLTGQSVLLGLRYDTAQWVHQLGIGTNGDPAPTGPVDPGNEDNLTASSIESASETGTPSITQTHALTADSVESATNLSAPAITQTHALTSNNIESTSETTQPGIGQTHNLASVGVESASTTSEPAIAQTHALAADSIESSSELITPALSSDSTVDALSDDDISASSEVGAQSIGQIHNLAANDAETDSETGAPTLAQTHNLTPVSIESLSTVSSPALTEVAGTDNLAANDIESQSETGVPSLGQVHVLVADNLQSDSSTSEPGIAQIHQLSAASVQSLSEVSAPTLRDASLVLKTPIRNTKATVSQVRYKAATIQTDYKARAS